MGIYWSTFILLFVSSFNVAISTDKAQQRQGMW